MKWISAATLSTIMAVVLIVPACKKQLSCEGCSAANKPPVACAGADQEITLPVNNIVLDGSCSSDPDVNITGYAWTRIAGPVNATLATPNAVSSNVNNLSTGIYQFQLKVTDAKGLFSFDTVQVSVKVPVDVYIAGVDNGKPVYWKNGQAVLLPLPSNNRANATSIVVVGNDVYVAGTEFDSQNVGRRAMYWKNGQPIYLSSSTSSEAKAITASGNDVYVAGYEGRVAKYWKNGQAVALTDGRSYAEATDIVVIGNDIYVAGTQFKNDSTTHGVYWKNGNVNSLMNSVWGNSIAVAGNDVYMTGAHISDEAKYWKNGQDVDLRIVPVFSSQSLSIAVDNGDVYVAGFDGSAARYWKNQIEVISLTSGAVRHSTARSIKVFQGDVYVAGTEEGLTGPYVAKYWKNEQAVTLSSGSSGGNAFSIFVKPQ